MMQLFHDALSRALFAQSESFAEHVSYASTPFKDVHGL